MSKTNTNTISNARCGANRNRNGQSNIAAIKQQSISDSLSLWDRDLFACRFRIYTIIQLKQDINVEFTLVHLPGQQRHRMFAALINNFMHLASCRYMKYLYPYECEKKNLSTPAELQAAIDGNRREGRRSSYGQYEAMHSQMPMVSTQDF